MIDFPNLGKDGLHLNVSRVAFTVFGKDIYFYGIIITLAVIFGVLYAARTAPKVGLVSDNIMDMAFGGILAGIVGARLYYVVFNIKDYDSVWDFFRFRDGGLAIYGGLIGACIAVVIISRLRKIKLAPFTDLLGLGFLIGHFIGRWGNFFNQEAFGAPTATNLPWGMTGNLIQLDEVVGEKQMELYDTATALVHPCFLYESLWCLIGFVFLHFYLRKLRTFDGEVFLLYIMWYGCGRAFIEGLRTDSLMLGNFKVSQVVAVSSAIFAAILFVYFKSTLTAKKGYLMYKDTEEGKEYVSSYKYKVKLERESEKAKIQLKETARELTEPFSQIIISDDDNDEEEDKDE